MTDTNRIASVASAAGVLGSMGNKFQERQLLSLASDMVLALPEADQASHMALVVRAHKAGLVKEIGSPLPSSFTNPRV